MSDIDEKQLLLYAQMANLVNLILQWPDINIKEIAENFSKVCENEYFRANTVLVSFVVEQNYFYPLMFLMPVPFLCLTSTRGSLKLLS